MDRPRRTATCGHFFFFWAYFAGLSYFPNFDATHLLRTYTLRLIFGSRYDHARLSFPTRRILPKANVQPSGTYGEPKVWRVFSPFDAAERRRSPDRLNSRHTCTGVGCRHVLSVDAKVAEENTRPHDHAAGEAFSWTISDVTSLQSCSSRRWPLEHHVTYCRHQRRQGFVQSMRPPPLAVLSAWDLDILMYARSPCVSLVGWIILLRVF